MLAALSISQQQNTIGSSIANRFPTFIFCFSSSCFITIIIFSSRSLCLSTEFRIEIVAKARKLFKVYSDSDLRNYFLKSSLLNIQSKVSLPTFEWDNSHVVYSCLACCKNLAHTLSRSPETKRYERRISQARVGIPWCPYGCRYSVSKLKVPHTHTHALSVFTSVTQNHHFSTYFTLPHGRH